MYNIISFYCFTNIRLAFTFLTLTYATHQDSMSPTNAGGSTAIVR